MTNLQPLNDNVLLKLNDSEERTSGGIYIPESARERPDEGEVVALPQGGVEGVAIGDRVIFKAHACEEVRLGGQRFRLVPSGDLLAKYVQGDAIAD